MPKKPSFTITKNEDGSVKSILLNHVRVSYPSLFKKALYQGVEQARGFQGTFLLSKEDHAETVEALQEVLQQHLDGLKVKKVKEGFCFLADGDDSTKEEYEDHWIVKAKSSTRPTVYGKGSIAPITDPEDNPIYAGCYANVKISVWSQKKAASSMVLADLQVIQFNDDGPAFGGGYMSDEEKADGFDADEDDDDFLNAA